MRLTVAAASGALVDVDVEAFGGEVALLLGPEDVGVDALILPIQSEPYLGRLLRHCGAGKFHNRTLEALPQQAIWSARQSPLLVLDQPIANSSLRRAQPVTRTSMNEKMT